MEKIKQIYGLIGIAAIALLSACSSDEGNTPGTKENPISLTQGQTRACEKNNDFALSYLKEADEASIKKNIVISPFTVYGMLGMLANGAAGETRQEIVEAIGFDDIDALNSYYLTLSSALSEADARTDIRLASSIWIMPGIQLKDEFGQTLTTFYDTESYSLSNDPSRSLREINKWASDKTAGRIPSFMSDLDSSVRAALFSATYFKGKWSKVFKKSSTAPGDFHNEDGSIMKSTDMMVKDERVAWYHTDAWDAIDIPYGNGSFCMTVVLPAEGGSVSETLEVLTPMNLTQASSSWSGTKEMEIKLPKFSIAPEATDITGVLGELGMKKAFNKELCDYSAMSSTLLYFNQIIQSSMIKVDEEGTEAASVSGSLGATSAGPADGKFHVDRPFIFLIREYSTGAILFAGTVRNPEYK